MAGDPVGGTGIISTHELNPAKSMDLDKSTSTGPGIHYTVPLLGSIQAGIDCDNAPVRSRFFRRN